MGRDGFFRLPLRELLEHGRNVFMDTAQQALARLVLKFTPEGSGELDEMEASLEVEGRETRSDK